MKSTATGEYRTPKRSSISPKPFQYISREPFQPAFGSCYNSSGGRNETLPDTHPDTGPDRPDYRSRPPWADAPRSIQLTLQLLPRHPAGTAFVITASPPKPARSIARWRGLAGKSKPPPLIPQGVGDIAVMVASPGAARFPEGAGVVVVVPPIFSTTTSFMTDPDLPSLGLIQVSFMWPGQTDSITGSKSSGTFDSGGEQSIQVLRDVIRFASGLIPDKNNRTLSTFTQVTPLTGEVGLYAFGDAGIAVVNAIKLYGDLLPAVQYFIGRENPTVDTLSCLEAGYVDDNGQPVSNPFYNYPASYSSSAINLTYTNVRWDAAYTDPHTGSVGRAYLDLDTSGTVSANDFIMSWRIPVIFGKRSYSVALTQALLDNGALTALNLAGRSCHPGGGSP